MFNVLAIFRFLSTYTKILNYEYRFLNAFWVHDMMNVHNNFKQCYRIFLHL